MQRRLAFAAALLTASFAFAQEDAPWIKRLAADPDSPAMRAFAAQQKKRVETERELKKLRAKHFRLIRNAPIRQEGIVKLRSYTDSALYPMLLDVFQGEGTDVQAALLDIFQDAQSEDGDTTLAWVAVMSKDAAFRDAATERLNRRIKTVGHAPESINLVVAQGMRTGDDDRMAAAARMVNSLGIIDAIPLLISGQLGGRPAAAVNGGGEKGTGDLAYIYVGNQIAFISDLTPVVGPSAVAFDPQLSVATEGVVLRIHDAVVVTYHMEVNAELIDMTSRMSGSSTKRLGFDVPGWQKWYADEFKPLMAAREAERKEARVKAAAQPK